MACAAAEPASLYPKLRLHLRLTANGSVSERLGADPKPRELTLDVDAQGVSHMMGALGWRHVGEGQAELAAESLSHLIESMLETANWSGGYDYSERPRAKESFDRLDSHWKDALEGRAPWRVGSEATGLWMESSCHLSSSRPIDAEPLRSAQWMCMHERGAQEVVGTLIDQFARLGAKATIGWSKGFGDWSQTLSKLPEQWSWPSLGAAICVEMQDDSAVCASLSAKGLKKLAQSDLGKAMGPRMGLMLLSSSKPLRVVCGPSHAMRSYSYAALPAYPQKHFPCQTFCARSDWRGVAGATAQEAMAALIEIAGPKGLARLDYMAPSQEGLGDMRREGVKQWLASCEALFLAKTLRRSLSTAVSSKQAKSSKNGPRL
jgi:hypothetical protein